MRVLWLGLKSRQVFLNVWQNYWSLWGIVPPAPCAAALESTPWACALLNFSLPFARSNIFVIEVSKFLSAFFFFKVRLRITTLPSVEVYSIEHVPMTNFHHPLQVKQQQQQQQNSITASGDIGEMLNYHPQRLC